MSPGRMFVHMIILSTLLQKEEYRDISYFASQRFTFTDTIDLNEFKCVYVCMKVYVFIVCECECM